METLRLTRKFWYCIPQIFILAVLMGMMGLPSMAQRKIRSQPSTTAAPINVNELLTRKPIPSKLEASSLQKDDLKSKLNLDQQLTTPPVSEFVFTGKGSWFTASNWKNNVIPPSVLKRGDHVIIDGTGPCLLNNAKTFLITGGSFLEIRKGKELYVTIGNNFVMRGGTLTNDGKLTVLSGVLSLRLSENETKTSGQLRTTALSKLSERKNSSQGPKD